ncbi:fd481706-75f0-48d7-87ec-5e8d11456a24 [Thermothielavioides terrestris]|uniref:Fd481706-75f0-48d7-87ec-5e8d11456a24 n=1 Tax=Thermothielavioides terrestris TaxID=2587410 RepID=A0A446BTI9_9PEZI|nr:fd481706-75f0-48d7-87ec-5e8d11456a24 [Thermothielavioides terrestris]
MATGSDSRFFTSAPPKNPQGLTLVHEPHDATADVIFVHGLGGSSWTTWCWRHDSSMFWPAWLQHEQGLSEFRIFTFGYNANWRGPDTPLSILDFAKGLLIRMRGFGDEDPSGAQPLGKRPIIFVAHSMGGLVVKKAYVLGKYDDHYTEMISRYHSRVDDNYILFITFLKQISRDLMAPFKQPSPVDRIRTLESVLGIVENPVEDLQKFASQGLQGSGEWLRERKSFQHWLSDPTGENRLFCLSGMPGTGKSTLAAMTVRHLQQAFLAQSCQFHFFLESQPTKKSVAYCLRSIAFQVASTHDVFAEQLLRLHQDVGDVLSSQKHQTIWAKIFEGILFKLDVGYTLHWVIDAVDESENPQAFLKFLSQMQSYSCIKIMLLSRPSKDITSALAQKGKAAIFDTITVRDTAADIRRYVRSVVTEALPAESLIREEIIERILARTEGSFLWARLVLDRLHHDWHTFGDIQKAMDVIPKDMQSLYRNMLLSIKNQEPRLQDIAQRILTWATCSFRPMRVVELQAALEPEFGGFISLKDTIVQVCGHFVRVDGDSVSLIHATARRFLVTPDGEEPEVIPSQGGHETLAKACLRYLSDDRWRRILSQVPQADTEHKDRLSAVYESHPLLSYALNYWAYHYIKLYLKRRKRARPSSLDAAEPRGETSVPGDNEVQFLERWAVDLIRLLGKFGSNLAETPSSIFKHIPPLCPRDSIIAQFGARQDSALIRVAGISSRNWDDNLARLSVGQDQTASKVRCSGVYFLTLVSASGTIIVWSAETCEELRRLEHGEWVVLFETNGTGSMVVSSGRFTFKIWDISTGNLLHSFNKLPEADPMHLAFGNTDTDLVVAYDDCSIVRYDAQTGTALARFRTDKSDKLRGCPRLMVLSPDRTQVVIAFRGRPVFVWEANVDAPNPPRRCIRAADESRSDENDVYSAPEVAVWHPDGDSLFILYQDTVLVHWNLIEDERKEYDNTEAREMVINSDGTLLLTSNNRGVLSVWALPKLNLVYRLHGNEFVRDIAFSPDSQRIYDGVLLVPRNGEVAIVRYGRAF